MDEEWNTVPRSEFIIVFTATLNSIFRQIRIIVGYIIFINIKPINQEIDPNVYLFNINKNGN